MKFFWWLQLTLTHRSRSSSRSISFSFRSNFLNVFGHMTALGGCFKSFWDDLSNFLVIWSRQGMSEDPGDIFRANNRPLIDEDCRFFLFLNLIYLGLNLIFRFFFLDNFPTARFFCPIAIMFLFCHFKLFSTFAAFWPCLPWTQNTKKEIEIFLKFWEITADTDGD